MKRAISDSFSGNERPPKLQRRDSSSTVPTPGWPKEQILPQPPSPLSNDIDTKQTDVPERELAIAPQSKLANERDSEIFEWIPPPSDEFKIMSQPSKRSRSLSTSTDHGRRRSVSPSSSGSSPDVKSYAYKAVNYVTILETKGCFMRSSDAGPIAEDVALCQRLLDPLVEYPRGTLFDNEFVEDFHKTLRNRSEARLLVYLHPLLMPSAENLFIQGRTELKDVIDGYNDPWLKTEPIYGPKPQPDHARGLRWSTFSESQRRKLGVKPEEKSLYAVREDMYFPYLTAEIKCGNQALEFADRQNMHSMCIGLRAVVNLAQVAGCAQEVHRRLLGFSISHELEGVRIYGYYPEINEDGIKYYRWDVKQFNIWTEEDKWACYCFVENLDREFLPIHTNRLIHFLERIPDPQDMSFEDGVDYDVGSQESRVGFQEPGYNRGPRGLQPELRSMIQNLQQQLEEQKAREEKLLAQLEQQRAEQKAREEKFLAQLEQQRAEQKAREEKLLAQLEQQRAEQRAREEQQRSREERLLSLLEQR